MAGLNDEKMRMMEDEMNRFEAEIALPVLPPPPPPPVTVNTVPPRAVIGSNTYHQVQRRLEEQQTISNMTEYQNGPAMGFHPMMTPANSFTAIPPPPPPPPPPLLVPHQVQRNPPLRHPIGPPGPIMGGPPPPPPPAFMGHIPPHPNAAFMGPPGPPMMDMGPSVAQPIPSMQSPMPAIVSATPLIYSPKSLEKSEASLAIEDSPEESILQKRKKFKMGLSDKISEISRAKEMSDRVKASTIVSTLGSNSDDHSGSGRKKEKKSKKHIRMAGGQVWEDSSLQEWEDDDFRIFCGDLGNDVTDEILTRAFSKYQSFLKAKVVRDKRSNKTKGFGFVSFKDPQDFIKAMKEMNGRYVGSRPIKLRKSTWKARNIDTVRKKEREKTALIGILTGR